MNSHDDRPETILNKDDAVVETINMDEATADLLERDADNVPAHADFWCISLTILEADIEMVINLTGDLMLGRQGASGENFTFVDLSGYNAHKHGVSRQHATIALHKNHVIIRDHNSSNHTLLNEKRLIPDEDYPLKPGDIVSLGRLKIRFNLIFDPFAL